jgi:hypothetical protein
MRPRRFARREIADIIAETWRQTIREAQLTQAQDRGQVSPAVESSLPTMAHAPSRRSRSTAGRGGSGIFSSNCLS